MKYLSTLSAVSLLALAACSSDTVKNTLGLERAPPDEFRVVSRPPLSVPPQFTLRPPTNVDISPNQMQADQRAQALINGTAPAGDSNGSLKADTAIMPVGETPAAPVVISKGSNTKSYSVASSKAPKPSSNDKAESQFLKDAGADKADPNVRDVLTEEKYTMQEKKEDKSWWDFWSDDPKDPIVDAKKESDRIQKDVDAGQPVTTGETPNIKPKNYGILQPVLGN